MRVLHSGTLDTNAGGPAMSTYFTLLGLRRIGIDAELIMHPLSPGGRMRGEGIPVHLTPAPRLPKFGYTAAFKRDVRALGPFDIYHAQGVWQYPTYALADIARQAGKPYVITPRGMLYPQDIAKHSTLLKRLSLKLRLLSDLNQAACVHATCTEEAQHCRNLGVTAPIAVIPNPIEVKAYSKSQTDGVFRFGYLGRVSRRKNIHGLIDAYIALGEQAHGTELLIIGDGDADYREELHRQALSVKHGTVRFLGFLNGAEKDAALSTLSVLVMPSEFENLGNVILEALVRRIPCIATQGAPWQELRTRRCGWWIDYYDPQALSTALSAALSTPATELQAMGTRGRQLIEQRFSVEAVAEQMAAVYRWICGQGERPECVLQDTTKKLGGGLTLRHNRPTSRRAPAERRAA